jgi:hypothetical protein
MGANAPAGLGDLDPQHRLRPVGPVKQPAPDVGPVVLQVERQAVHGHPVDARRALVAPDLRQRLPQIVALDNRLHGRPRGRRAFGPEGRRAGFGPFGSRAPGFTLRPCPKGQLQLVLLPLGRHETSRPTRHFRRSGLRPTETEPTMPSADFCTAITRLATGSVPMSRHGADLPR